jgi:hypothetical protein
LKRIRSLVLAVLFASAPLVATAQEGQEADVMKVIENVFPGFTDPGYADCVLQNANADEARQIANAGASGSFREAEGPLIEIAKKNTTQECIIGAGLPRFPV